MCKLFSQHVTASGHSVSWDQKVVLDCEITAGVNLANGSKVVLQADGQVTRVKGRGAKAAVDVVGEFLHLAWDLTGPSDGKYSATDGTVTAVFRRTAPVQWASSSPSQQQLAPEDGKTFKLVHDNISTEIGGVVTCDHVWSFKTPPGPMAVGWHGAIENYIKADWIMRLPDTECLDKYIYPNPDDKAQDDEASILDMYLHGWFEWMAGLPAYKGSDQGEATEHLWYYCVRCTGCCIASL